MTTIFVEDDTTRERIDEIRAYAENPLHWYLPSLPATIPGARSEYILEVGTIRAVFSLTKVPTHSSGGFELFRHLTVSNRIGLPSPLVVWRLCVLFGFDHEEGSDVYPEFPDERWIFGENPQEQCIAVLQRLRD